MRLSSFLTVVFAGAASTVATPALAQLVRPDLASQIGVETSLGGGVTGFTDSDVTDITGTGGSWVARVAVGTRMHLAGEMAYIGTAQSIDTLGLDSDSVLVANGLEGDLRLNVFADEMWQPYAFVGLAWKHYNISNDDFNTSDLRDSDDVGEVPMGIGVAFRYAGFVMDVRGEYRPAFDSDLIPGFAGGEDNPSLHNWGANARIGWEF